MKTLIYGILLVLLFGSCNISGTGHSETSEDLVGLLTGQEWYLGFKSDYDEFYRRLRFDREEAVCTVATSGSCWGEIREEQTYSFEVNDSETITLDGDEMKLMSFENGRLLISVIAKAETEVDMPLLFFESCKRLNEALAGSAPGESGKWQINKGGNR